MSPPSIRQSGLITRNSEGAIEMTHTNHDISVANHIGKYSDAIAVGPNMRWLMTSRTPGLTAAGGLPNDITGQAELAWQNVMNLLAKADVTVDDIVKVTQLSDTRGRHPSVCSGPHAFPRRQSTSFDAARHSPTRLARDSC
jgi:enamine deaminase RidA (YjgF/YER057c/UK114 family)